MNTATNQESALHRAIGKLGYGAININSVIGAGIFGLPAVVAAKAGYFSPWAFLLGGVMVFTMQKGGLMYEASIGGQKSKFNKL